MRTKEGLGRLVEYGDKGRLGDWQCLYSRSMSLYGRHRKSLQSYSGPTKVPGLRWRTSLYTGNEVRVRSSFARSRYEKC